MQWCLCCDTTFVCAVYAQFRSPFIDSTHFEGVLPFPKIPNKRLVHFLPISRVFVLNRTSRKVHVFPFPVERGTGSIRQKVANTSMFLHGRARKNALRGYRQIYVWERSYVMTSSCFCTCSRGYFSYLAQNFDPVATRG